MGRRESRFFRGFGVPCGPLFPAGSPLSGVILDRSWPTAGRRPGIPEDLPFLQVRGDPVAFHQVCPGGERVEGHLHSGDSVDVPVDRVPFQVLLPVQDCLNGHSNLFPVHFVVSVPEFGDLPGFGFRACRPGDDLCERCQRLSWRRQGSRRRGRLGRDGQGVAGVDLRPGDFLLLGVELCPVDCGQEGVLRQGWMSTS